MADHKNIYAALLAAQNDFGAVKKNHTNPAFKSKYADLAAVIEAIEEPLAVHGLLFFQPLSMTPDGQPTIRTVIVHAATGEKIESEAPLVCKDPSNPQAVGGAITYFRRYSLLSLLGLAPEDDDGQAASKAPAQRTRPAASRANGNQPPPEPEEAPTDVTSWTVAWKVLRDLKIASGPDFANLTGHAIDKGLSPQQAIDLARSCLADVAASHAE